MAVRLVSDRREHVLISAHFAKEIHTIHAFFGSRIRKKAHSKNDARRLSDLHGRATRCESTRRLAPYRPALEAGGLTHLMEQVFTLTDFLTPTVIRTVTDLLQEWGDDRLTAKSYVLSAVHCAERLGS